MSGDVRTYLIEQLDLPSNWVVIKEQRFPDAITKTTVILQHTRIEPLTEAPLGNLRHTVTLSILDPRQNVAAAEDALDDAVTELIGALDSHASISWSEAEKTVHADSFVGWNITLTVITSKE